MKKLLIFALCLLGICNARAAMMTAQEIILTEMADSEEKTQMLAGIGTGYHSASLWEIEGQP